LCKSYLDDFLWYEAMVDTWILNENQNGDQCLYA
jgi:hypothetical protein